MSLKYSSTTADYLVWSDAMNLIRKLAKDENYKISLLIALGCFTGLRISDILSLRWKQILDADEFTVIEKKTGKVRTIRLNPQLQQHIKECYEHINPVGINAPILCFTGLRISDILSLRWKQILDADEFTVIEKKTGKVRTIRLNPQLQQHIKECYEHINPVGINAPILVSQKGTIFTVQRINIILKEVKKKYRLKIKNFSCHSLRKTFGRQVYNMNSDNAELALVKLMELFNHSSVAITKRYLGLSTGLRISDILSLRWKQILGAEEFTVIEKKTSKVRNIRLNPQLQQHIKECYEHINPVGINAPILISQKGTIFTVQRINIILKEVKKKYRLKIKNFSCHSLRKTFGRQVYNMNSDNAELALVKLMELFNHSSVAITKRYLGLRQEEILQTYDCLSF